MGHLIPMNLQLNAEVGDKGAVKGDIVPSSGEEGGWSSGEMASLQHEWVSVSWGGQGAGDWLLALCPALLDPATKTSLIPIWLLLGEEVGGLDPSLSPLPGPQAKSSLWEWG